MVRFLENISLRNLNTFRVEAKARYYFLCTSPEQIHEVFEQWPTGQPLLILGGGSNILFTRNFDGLVLQVGFYGKRVLSMNKEFVVAEALAGENWDDFVLWAVEQDFGGLENLSAIPGTVGASPVQNIGAYGVEAGDCIESVTYYSITEKNTKTIPGSACNFGYRSSIFKNQPAGQVIILSVRFLLSLNHRLNTEYGGLQEELKKYGERSIRSVRDAVIAIRSRKLPDPKEIGNAGSFFKNPVIPQEVFSSLVAEYPDVPSYSAGEGRYKIPAAWLIEKCGWKGYRTGNAGVHRHQPLVIVNYGNATGAEIQELSEKIRASVYNRFGIRLEPEVRII